MKKICLECGKEFEAKADRKYCSMTCFKKHRREYKRLESKLWRETHKQDRSYRKEKDKQLHRRYFLNNKKIIYEKVKLWALKNEEKILAQRLSQQIQIPRGQICVECKKKLATQRHHEDYDKPYDVSFVCISCHRKLNISRRKREVERLNA